MFSGLAEMARSTRRECLNLVTGIIKPRAETNNQSKTKRIRSANVRIILFRIQSKKKKMYVYFVCTLTCTIASVNSHLKFILSSTEQRFQFQKHVRAIKKNFLTKHIKCLSTLSTCPSTYGRYHRRRSNDAVLWAGLMCPIFIWKAKTNVCDMPSITANIKASVGDKSARINERLEKSPASSLGFKYAHRFR